MSVPRVDLTTFAADVLACPLPALVAFTADWCGHCRRLKPVLERLHDAAAGEYRVFLADSDENPELTRRHRIRGLPTCLVFHAGRESARLVGARDYLSYREALADAHAMFSDNPHYEGDEDE